MRMGVWLFAAWLGACILGGIVLGCSKSNPVRPPGECVDLPYYGPCPSPEPTPCPHPRHKECRCP